MSTTAMAMNIYKNPETFFAPESNAFQTDNKSAVLAQEFPIYPGAVAALYGIFGPHIWVARMLGISIAALGWLFLLKLCLTQESKSTSFVILTIYSFNS
ncbi:MAG: hypothetical protein GY786_11010, partial [Proteobacteria bacterium]|nr:hypothetical protein [Pseudomonadota bacterium]